MNPGLNVTGERQLEYGIHGLLASEVYNVNLDFPSSYAWGLKYVSCMKKWMVSNEPGLEKYKAERGMARSVHRGFDSGFMKHSTFGAS
ncbi:hypothetical protein RJ035_007432, partial [Blastomyces gilchristii]